MGAVLLHVVEFIAAAGLIGGLLSLAAPSDREQPFHW